MDSSSALNEFSRFIDSLEFKDDETRSEVAHLISGLLDESHWQSLDEQALSSLLYEGISFYGHTNWEPLVEFIGPVYLHAMETLPVEARMQLQTAINQCQEANQVSANAMLPFLMLEKDLSVVSTATINFTMVPAPEEDDPLGWPKRLISDLDARMPANLGAVFGGLISLGDRRVNEMLRETKWLISDDEIGTAVKCVTGSPLVGALEFWLEWLEELTNANLNETGLYGQVASGLGILPRNLREDKFTDASLNFGYLHEESGRSQSMTVHGEFSKSEIAERYADRFYALEDAEPPPKIMSHVLLEFGLEPKAPFEQRYTIQ